MSESEERQPMCFCFNLTQYRTHARQKDQEADSINKGVYHEGNANSLST